jgi:hypothetical protein
MKQESQANVVFHPGSTDTAGPGLRDCSLCPNRSTCRKSPDVAWQSGAAGRNNVPPASPIPSPPGN